MRQFEVNKNHPEIQGTIHFSMKGLMENKQGIADSLRNGAYRYPALVPPANVSRGQAGPTPENLRMQRFGSRQYLLWEPVEAQDGMNTAYYVVYLFKGNEPIDLSDPKKIFARVTDSCLDLTGLQLEKSNKGYVFVVTSVNRYKHESKPAIGKHRFK